jgi:hypothetical protein
MATISNTMRKISLLEYATKHNPRLNRRGHKMSESYLYRLIRKDIKGEKPDLWFKYVLEGEKDRIYILLS